MLPLGVRASKQILHYPKTMVSSLPVWVKCNKDVLGSNLLSMLQCLRELDIIGHASQTSISIWPDCNLRRLCLGRVCLPWNLLCLPLISSTSPRWNVYGPCPCFTPLGISKAIPAFSYLSQPDTVIALGLIPTGSLSGQRPSWFQAGGLANGLLPLATVEFLF